jgi:hypothetical protein
MLNKLILFIQIKQFYKVFGEIVGSNFITELSDITHDNLYDVMFDINEVLDTYGYDDVWLTKLFNRVAKFSDHSFNDLLFNICNKKVHGFYELRPYTKPVYKLAQWLYKKGVKQNGLS